MFKLIQNFINDLSYLQYVICSYIPCTHSYKFSKYYEYRHHIARDNYRHLQQWIKISLVLKIKDETEELGLALDKAGFERVNHCDLPDSIQAMM